MNVSFFKKVALIPLLFALLLPAQIAFAESNVTENFIERAKVTEIISETIRTIPGTDTNTTYQSLRAEILTGIDKGAVVTVDNDYLNLQIGDQFYASHTRDGATGLDTYNVQEPYRLPVISVLVALFVLVIIVFGGRQGVRGLLSLAVSLVAILYILIPGILAGYSPILLSIGISSFIVVIGSYITHGLNRTTSSAVLGMIATIGVTGVLAYWSVHAGMLSGYSSDEITYLHFSTHGAIDFVGLLLGGIMIGLLGILYDAGIGQAIAVEELKRAGTHYSPRELYSRAIRIGREHIGALVNTLAIAYVGASLPLLLLLHYSNMSFSATVNQEIFATEIIRTVVGSIGLILAVPITTLISIWMLYDKDLSKISPVEDRHSHKV